MLSRDGPLRDALFPLLCRVPPPPLVFVERFRLVCRVVPCELVGRPASFGQAVSAAPCPANARRSPPSSRTASGRRRGWCPHVVTVNAPYCFWWCGTGWGIDLLLFQVPLSPAGGFYTLLHRALPFSPSPQQVHLNFRQWLVQVRGSGLCWRSRGAVFLGPGFRGPVADAAFPFLRTRWTRWLWSGAGVGVSEGCVGGACTLKCTFL